MRCFWTFVTLVLVGTTASAQNYGGDGKAAKERGIGRRIAPFVLPTPEGKPLGLADVQDAKATVVVFMSTRCPIGNGYVPTLNELADQYREKKVQFLAVYPSPADSEKDVAKHVKDFKLTFPALIDARQTTVQQIEAKRTPEVVLLDHRLAIRYRGRIDDRIGQDYRRDEAKRHELREAIDEVIAGKKVTVAETEPAGCLITPVRKTVGKDGPTYAKDVAAILHSRCADCHHPGTTAPFSLLTYEDASNWSAMIREVVARRTMPPWHADPRFGHFANARRLSQNETETILAWVDAGSPRGDAKAEPKPPTFEEGWRIGKPDVVFKMPETYKVPAKGTIRYKYFATKTNFKEDMWVQAAETKPGNRAVVHHIIVSYRDPKSFLKAPVWLVSTAPGAEPLVLPPGMGRKIPAGAEIIFQMHYTATGKEEEDCSEVGLVFCKEPPKQSIVNHGIANTKLKIPAGEPNYVVSSSVPALKDAVVLALYPHMHVRGKDFTYYLVHADGKKETILSIPQYDFNWQNTYRFKEPLFVPRGSKIQCVAHFDNSLDNPANPDATREVRWGDQTWDEMMIGYIDFYWVEEKSSAKKQ
jgi:peroxiredoxin